MVRSNTLFVLLLTISYVKICHPFSPTTSSKNSFLGIESEKIGFSSQQVEEAFGNLEKVKSHSLGRKILDTIAIQLKSDVPLKEISKLLSDLGDELQRQQNEVDKTRDQFEDSCTNDIGKYDERIQTANEIINDIDVIIIKLKSNLVTLNSTIKNRDFQIELLNRKEKDIVSLRKRDEVDFERRRRQSGEILTAISLIIPKLENLGSKRELQEALMQLSSIGSTNPINSLVFLSSTFENSALETIKEKLQKLKKSLEASIVDDEQYDADAAIAVRNLVEEIKTTRKEVEAERAAEEANQRDVERNLKLQLNRREESMIESKTAENGRNQRLKQCSEYFYNYKLESAHRLEEIEIVTKVQNLLASKMELVRKYIDENS